MPSDSAGVVDPPSSGSGLSLGSDDGPGPSPKKSKKGLIIGGVIVFGALAYMYAKSKSSASTGATGTSTTLVQPSTTGDSTQSANDAALLAALANGGLLSTAQANAQSQQQANIGSATAVGALSGGGFLPGGETGAGIPTNPGDLSATDSSGGLFTWITPNQFQGLAPGTATFTEPVPGTFLPTATPDSLAGLLPNTPVYIRGGQAPTANKPSG